MWTEATAAEAFEEAGAAVEESSEESLERGVMEAALEAVDSTVVKAARTSS